MAGWLGAWGLPPSSDPRDVINVVCYRVPTKLINYTTIYFFSNELFC